MSSANEGFAYMFNTPREDRKGARVLSGWAPDDAPSAADPTKLDSATRSRLARIQARVFSCCSGLADACVLEALTATLVLHYPQLKALSAEAPLVRRLDVCAVEAGGDATGLLSLANALQESARASDSREPPIEPAPAGQASDRDAAIIRELIAVNRALSDRLCVCESALLRLPAAGNTAQAQRRSRDNENQAQSEAPAPKRRKKAAAASQSTVWYEWYTKVPRFWESEDRQRKSDSRLLTAYLKLFLPSGFAIAEEAASFREDVLALGTAAQAATLEFLRGHGVTAGGTGTVLKALRKLHWRGALDDKILGYKRLLAGNKITDPAPLASQDILALASTPGL